MGNDYILKSVRTAAVVGTTAFVADTVLENKSLEDELIILADFTIGLLTSTDIKVEFSPDNTNWYQETNEMTAAGATSIAVVQVVHNLSATGKYRLTPIKIKDRYIKISAMGNGTTAATSSLTIDAILGQDV